MIDEDQARRERARQRRAWPGGLRRLEDLPEVEVLDDTPERLIDMVYELTLAAWAMRGEPIPDYDRKDAPGRVIRPDDP